MRTFLALVVGVSAGVALAVTLGGRAIADNPLGAAGGVAPAAPEPPDQPAAAAESTTTPETVPADAGGASQAINSAVQATQEGAPS